MATLAYYPSQQHASLFRAKQHQHSANQLEHETGVPDGFPEKLHSPLAWTRDEIEKRRDDWIVELGSEDIQALEQALASFEALSVDLSQISAETFVLPAELARRLRNVSNEVYNGVGFTIVHGINPSRYTPEQNVALYAGIAAHVAPRRGFLDRGAKKVLCHVVNALGESTGEQDKTPGFTNGPLSFHSDMCEVLSLYALDVAPEGGRTLVSSAWQVYNDLAARRPDILQTLADDWVLDTFADYSKFPPISTPFIHKVADDKVIWRFSRYPITGFSARKRNPTLPPPTPAQIEAIDAVHFMAEANSMALPMQKGDMVFINDMAILHAREPFSEGGVFLQRHLLKFYLSDPEQTWPVPPAVADAWKKIYGPNSEEGVRNETWSVRWGAGQEDGWASNG